MAGDALSTLKFEKESININQRGGRRPQAGRKKGSPNKITAAMRAKFLDSGMMPLDALMMVMNELLVAAEWVDERTDLALSAKMLARLELLERAADVAAKAAPYLHPKLQSIQHTGKNGEPIERHVTVEFVEAREGS